MKRALDLVRRCEAHPSRARAEAEAFGGQAGPFPLMEGDTACFFFLDRTLLPESVALVHWVFGLESRQPFRRVPGTDAWILSIELPHGARIEYKLELTFRDGSRTWVADPRNPHRAFDPFGSNSVCRMTGYQDPPWVLPEPGAREGALENFTIASAAFGDNRTVTVYTPAEYKRHKKYPLLVCHDGDDYLKYSALKTVLDNLIHRKEVRPLVVAMTSGHRRNEEYAANPTQARFVAEELLPAVTARYGVSDKLDDRGIMGASFGGVTSLFTAWSYPGIFGRLLLQSGSFAFTDIGRHDRGPLWDPVVAFVNQLRAEPSRLVSRRIYMSCGQFESLIYYTRSLAPLLRAAGHDLRFVESRDGHNWIGWRDRLREGLTTLFPGHLWMVYD